MARGCAARVCRIRDHYRRRKKRVWRCDSLNVDDVCDDKSIQRRAVAPLDAECVSEIHTHDRVPSLCSFTRHSHAHKGCKKVHLPTHSTPHRASSSSSSSSTTTTHASTTRRTRRARARQALVLRTHRARSRRTSPSYSRARIRNHEPTPAHNSAHFTANDALTTRLLAHSAACSTPESLR